MTEDGSEERRKLEDGRREAELEKEGRMSEWVIEEE